MNMRLNNKGITMVEVLVAVMLTAIAVVGLMTMQPMAWQSAGKADSMTRATEIMQRELEAVEYRIMSGNFSALSDLGKDASETVGHETFTVKTSVTEPTANNWLVRVGVTWTGNAKGVRSSLIVTRQSGF